MVGLPRRHQTSVPIWVEVTNASRVGQISRWERFETWPATARDVAPRLSLKEAVSLKKEQPGLASHSLNADCEIRIANCENK